MNKRAKRFPRARNFEDSKECPVLKKTKKTYVSLLLESTSQREQTEVVVEA